MKWFQNWLDGKPLVDPVPLPLKYGDVTVQLAAHTDKPTVGLRFDVTLPEDVMYDPAQVQDLVAPAVQALQDMVDAAVGSSLQEKPKQ